MTTHVLYAFYTYLSLVLYISIVKGCDFRCDSDIST